LANIERRVKKLDDYRHARLRVENLFGSREIETRRIPIFDGNQLSVQEVTWVPAIFTCFREILDNALDEVVSQKHGDTISVDFDADNYVFTVRDNGRGIPLSHDPELGGIVASVALSEARTGRNFEQRSDEAGMNGVGASGVNFTSEFFEAEVWRDKKHFYQLWTEGADETHETDGPQVKGTRGSKEIGTKVKYTPSRKVFANIVIPDILIRSHLWMIAAMHPSVKIVYNGVHLKPTGKEDAVMAKTIFAGYKPFSISAISDVFKGDFWVIPNFTDDEEIMYGLVNRIPSWAGMDHVDLFRNLFYNGVLEILEKRAKKERLELARKDVTCGVLMFSVANVTDATFDSQSKSRLTKAGVNSAIRESFNIDDVAKLLKQNPEWVEQIIKRCRDRAEKQDADDARKIQKKKRGTKVVGLMPATGLDRMKCILFLTEGESAISSLSSIRKPEIHGGYGLRGKVMNTHPTQGVTTKKILGNGTKEHPGDPVLTGIMNAIGLELNVKAIRRQLRYGRVYLAMDEDPDGASIAALLAAFFYRWPELFEPDEKLGPFLYRFETPYVVARKGKTHKYWYAHNYDDFEKNLEKYKGWDITKAKGLAALREDDWANAIADPVVSPYIEDGKLKDLFDVLYAKDRVEDRKVKISNGY
jgi:DNA gyrase subunit B